MMITREALADGSFRAAVAEADPTLRLLSDEERVASLRATFGDRLGRDDIWVFAYGSLIWSPTFLFVEQRLGLLRGWRRRFCLWVPVGRGTPERPALMLGLERGGSCRGVAFRIAAEAAAELDLLWRREMVADSYCPRLASVETDEGPIDAVMFTINHRSQRYADHLSEEEITAVISTAHGPFGPCAEYLFNTVDHLRKLGIHDRALERLQTRVIALQSPGARG
jgi:cation transport protein ChaC